MQQNGYYRNLKWTFKDIVAMLLWRNKGETIRSRLSQLAFAANGANSVNCKLMTALYQNSELTLV